MSKNTESKIERRAISAEFRVGGDDGRRIEGLAAIFNSRIELWPGRLEEIAPGAFTRTLKDGADVRALFNHDSNLVLGRTKSGTLTLSEGEWKDKSGLVFGIDIPDTTCGNDLMESLKRGDISQSSFAFEIVAGGEQIETLKNGDQLRTITEVKLYDVSPVTFPAYQDTEAVARIAFRNMPEQENDPEPVFHSFPQRIARKQALAELNLKLKGR